MYISSSKDENFTLFVYNLPKMAKNVNYKKLLALLIKSKKIAEPFKKRLYVLAVITKALENFNVQPVLIGGGAVEYYTFGGYATYDIDVAVMAHEKFDKVMKKLSFKSEGRHWLREDLGIYIESPASDIRAQGNLAPYTEVRINNLRCYIIGIEDIIVDRLNGFVHWKWKEDERLVKEMIKLHSKEIDWRYLNKRAKEEKTIKALQKINRSLKR